MSEEAPIMSITIRVQGIANEGFAPHYRTDRLHRAWQVRQAGQYCVPCPMLGVP